MKPVKEIVIDVETTGLSPYNCAIWQIAGLIKVEGKPIHKFEYHLAPHEGAKIDKKALEVGNVTEEELASFPSHDKGYKALCDLLGQYVDVYDKTDKFTFIGYNALFDMDFLRQLWWRNQNKYFGSWFFFPPIDVMILAAKHFIHRRSSMPDMKLGTVAAALGIEVDEEKQHDAEYDVDLTWQAYQLLMA